MKRIALFVVAALLAGCATAPGGQKNSSDTLRITESVWSSYQRYLGLIGSAHPGAFAVTADGYSSYTVWCSEVVCAGGPTYKQEALSRCRSSNGTECVIFGFGTDILVAYEIVASPVTESVASSSNSVSAPAPEEPPFESPLADGTIVLSHKVAAMLDGYLNTPAISTRKKRGYFFVSEDGRSAGSYVCPGICLDHMGGSWA